jgi:ABC-2 type transport system ATP-binding protein
VTSIDPEILILDEGIGAVDAAFLEKARDRLRDLVGRSGMLVFASHSDEFLVELCDTAIWMDTGEIREQGDLREVVSHYKGRDLFESLSPETLRRLDLQRASSPDASAGPADAPANHAADHAADETVGLP